jgi:hypothetical protein
LKLILLLALALLFSSCEENIESYDTLNPDEQAYIQSQARIKCENNTANILTTLKETSNTQMARFARGQYWEITVIGTTTPDYVYVWKVDGTTVYFLYQKGKDSTHNFIKMTPTFNGEMFDNLRVQKCATKIPLITLSASSYSVKNVDVPSTSGADTYRTDTTFSSLDDYPAFFGLFAKQVFKEKLDTNGNVVSSENLTNSIVYKGNNAVLFATFDLYSGKNYCVFTYANGPPKTFTLLANPDELFDLTCVTNSATNPNTFGDATMDFTPSDDL